MPELRKDPIVGRWVIIASERARRPDLLVAAADPPAEGICPFCPENEDLTPPEVLAYRQDGTPPNTPGWTLRAVPNKFPVLRVEGELGKTGIGLYDRMNGIGAHEVIIETPQHESTLSHLSREAFADVLRAYRDRILDLKQDGRLRYVLIFKNQGKQAGATLYHTHSQLIALPAVPKVVAEELQGAKTYYRYHERCVFCDIVHQELAEGSRVVALNDAFIALAPFAPRFPFETWIMPRRHTASFESIPEFDIAPLAELFSEVLRRLDKALSVPPYNFNLHTSPVAQEASAFYHWHFEIMPKLTQAAGFEWGSGFHINPTPPEEAAGFLRGVTL